MEAHLQAGLAIYNAGDFHAAHDAWEDHWLSLEADTDDERFLHGLIQFTAAVHHGYHANWKGLLGLAKSASEYLEGLPGDYRGMNLATIRRYLNSLRDDPEYIERVSPPSLTYEGQALEFEDLDFESTGIAAQVIAEETDQFEEEVLEDAVRFASEAIKEGESDEFVSLVFDFVRKEESRGTIYARLRDHVNRRRQAEGDVEGLFDDHE